MNNEKLDSCIREEEEEFKQNDFPDIEEHLNGALKEQLMAHLNRMNESKKHNGSYIFSNLKELDELTGGFNSGSVVIVGGRPCMGKTSFCLNLLMHNVLHLKIPSIYIGLDEIQRETLNKIFCLETDHTIFEIKTMTPEQQTQKLDEFLTKNPEPRLWLNFFPTLSPKNLHDCIRHAVEQNAVRLIVVDGIKSLADYWKGREPRNVEAVIRIFLEDQAKKYQCVILLTVPLLRTVEEREDHRPNLGDLPVGTASSNMTILLYRPAVYYPVSSDKNSIEIIVANNKRTNRLGSVMVNFDARKFCFSDAK